MEPGEHSRLNWGHKLNEVVAPTVAPMPDMLSLIEHSNTASGVWYGVSNLRNNISFPVRKENHK